LAQNTTEWANARITAAMDDMEDVENIFDLFAEDEAPRTHQMVSGCAILWSITGKLNSSIFLTAKGVQSQRGSMPRKKRNQTGFAGRLMSP
jgi:hypothetical protein